MNVAKFFKDKLINRLSIRAMFVMLCAVIATSSYSEGINVEDLLKKTEVEFTNKVEKRDDFLKEVNSRSTLHARETNYNCSFCCEGQFGSCRSKTIKVETPHNDINRAKEYIRNNYKEYCYSFPFYSSAKTGAVTSFASCN